MAWDTPGLVTTFPASTGLKQHRFVTMNTSGKVTYPSASTVGQAILGVTYDSGTTGSTSSRQYASVQVSGIAKVSLPASSTVAVGDWITSSSAGQVQSSSNAGDFIVGLVVSGASSSVAHVVSVALIPVGTTA